MENPGWWLEWIERGGVVGVLVLVVALWLTERLVTAKARDREIAAMEAATTGRIEATHAACDAEVAGHIATIKSQREQIEALQTRMENVVVDRDMWREAYNASNNARRSADKAAEELMGASRIAISLVEALERATRSGSTEEGT